MNVNTGEITQDMELARLWEEKGDPVIYFPSEEEARAAQAELFRVIGGTIVNMEAIRDYERDEKARELARTIQLRTTP